MGLAGENLDAVHHHRHQRQEGGADPPSFCGILSGPNAGWKEHGSIRPARAADSHAHNLSDGKSFVCLMPYGMDYSTILIMIAISYDVVLSSFTRAFFLSLPSLPATLLPITSSAVVPRSASTNRSPNGAAVPSFKGLQPDHPRSVLSLPLLDVTPKPHLTRKAEPTPHCRKELDAVAHWRSPSWLTGGESRWVGGMGPGPKSDAFRVSNRRVMPFSPSALNTNYGPRCSSTVDTARHETNTSIWVDPHRLQMGRFPVCGGGGCHPTDSDSGSCGKYYGRGLGIDSVLGLFRRGTKGRIPTWSTSWRPFCRVADFLSSLPVRVKLKLGTSPAASPSCSLKQLRATSFPPLILSLLPALPSTASIDGVRTSSNWPGTQSPTAHRHLK
ncbi:hypothetical protein M747DRAFT_310103 [Aspergillus niger ATCC 13496]|uniref:Contig An07c0300, genomic contig n=3 Tax=Aspergillus niger TaxID=5061 RepID=A2QPA8_ASPNC|nr:uncharacterized protein An07g08800 [Aspergillus niger]RDH15308.1 hypothetical protein M747DRAFT_310103 [Aspergillus niger ATCC 13496]CAK39673.1 unnamed protein product [Aspergillus niger]